MNTGSPWIDAHKDFTTAMTRTLGNSWQRRYPVDHPCKHQLQRGQVYINDPGVVSTSPVSSHVFRPDRIIGHPPYS